MKHILEELNGLWAPDTRAAAKFFRLSHMFRARAFRHLDTSGLLKWLIGKVWWVLSLPGAQELSRDAQETQGTALAS